MLRRLKNNFDNGVEKVKWVSSMLSDRFNVELSVFKLLYSSEQMEKQKEDLMKKIGERVCELKSSQERNILKDSIIIDAMQQIERLNSEIESTKQKASEISRVEP